MKAQLASPAFTSIYAALTAVINTKLPENGETLLKRVIMQFRRSYKRNDKPVCTAMVKFIAHLINQQVCHEILGLQLLTVLLEKPTDDSVELAVSFVKEAGAALQQLSPQGLHAIFERFRGILHDGAIDMRVQYMIEGLFAVRKNNFADFPALEEELDLVDADDQITHELSLDDQLDPEAALDIFHVDPQVAVIGAIVTGNSNGHSSSECNSKGIARARARARARAMVTVSENNRRKQALLSLLSVQCLIPIRVIATAMSTERGAIAIVGSKPFSPFYPYNI